MPRELQRAHDHRLDPSILDRARGARTGRVTQPVQAMRDKATAPLADRRFVHPEMLGDILVQPALGARQHDPSAQRQCLRRIPPHRQRTQFAPLHSTQI
jgi:hypothetical protein